MKKLLANLMLAASLAATAGAIAQTPAATGVSSAGTTAAGPAAAATNAPAAAASKPAPSAAGLNAPTVIAVPNARLAPATAPNVESIDILRQNQAERTRDQPGNAAPTFRIIKEGTKNYSSLPAPEAGILIQGKQRFPLQARATTAGEAWRNYRNGPLTHLGGWLLVATVAALAAVYLLFGPVRLKNGRSGHVIERFTAIERWVHWATAATFLILAASGLTMLFGKYVLLPVFGHGLFGWLAYLCKNVHNFLGPLFTLSIIATFIIFLKDNFPAKEDLQWLLRLGGMFGGKHAHAGRFNAGEKLWFWFGVVGLCLLVSASGFVLDMVVPGIAYSRANMQIANVVHVVGAVMVFAASLGHIYIGSLGMEGALEAMTTGYVDDAWAAEHHDLWYEDVQSGRVPRVRTPPRIAAGRPGAAPASS